MELRAASGLFGFLTGTARMPPGRTAWTDGAQRRRRARGEAVHVPGGRPGRGRAVLGGQCQSRVVGAGRPASRCPARRHARHRGRVGDQGGLARHDEIELPGRHTERAARVTCEISALAGGFAGFEPEAALGPQRADAGDVRAAVRVDRGQPAGVPSGPPSPGAWLRPSVSRASIPDQSSSGKSYKPARLVASMAPLTVLHASTHRRGKAGRRGQAAVQASLRCHSSAASFGVATALGSRSRELS